ncbi:MAG: hypothetical protein GX661_01985, partial [Acholeplasmataceae bacterium]|nr:hypothetical protein [Acholeplasmataceae bacterium]
MDLVNIYLFTGDQTLLVSNKIDRIIKESKADQYNISIYDEEESNITEAIRDASTPPFMGLTKIVIIKNPKSLSNEKQLTPVEEEAFRNYLVRPLDSTILIINAVGIKLDEKKDLVKILRKTAEAYDIKSLSEIELIGWAKRQCSLYNVGIKDDAIKTFCRLVG